MPDAKVSVKFRVLDILRGAVAIAFAIFAFINPKLGLVVLAVVFGFELLIVHVIKLVTDSRSNASQKNLQGTNIGIDVIAIAFAIIIIVTPTLFIHVLILPIVLGLIIFGAGRIANGGFDQDLSPRIRYLNIIIGILMFVLVIIIIFVPQIALLFAYVLGIAFLLLGAESIISGIKGKREVIIEASEEQPEGSEISVKTIKSVQHRSIVFRAIEESLGRLVKPVRGKAAAKKEVATPLQQRIRPLDVLINEHKLILQAIDKFKAKSLDFQTTQQVDLIFITNIVDFFANYADEFHHGKEGILFKKLSQKKLSDVDSKMMDELMTEHIHARQTLTAIENTERSHFAGNKESLKEIVNLLVTLAELYPTHIRKEDEQFFPACMNYFSEQELKAMESSFLDFNKNFTDKKYKQIIDFLP